MKSNQVPQKIKLSVLCPVYNGGDFVVKNIDNLIDALKDTSLCFEVIISDDFSHDYTEKACEDIKKKYFNIIRVYRQKKNIGIYANYNFLIAKSKGEYFVTMDQDDTPEFLFYNEAVNFLEKNKLYSLAYSHARVIGSQSNKIIRYETCFNMGVGEFARDRFVNTIINNETLAMVGVIRKKYFNRTRGYVCIPGGDHILLNELSLYGDFFCFDKICYDYYEDEEKYIKSSDVQKISGKKYFFQTHWILKNIESVWLYPEFNTINKIIMSFSVCRIQKFFFIKDLFMILNVNFWIEVLSIKRRR